MPPNDNSVDLQFNFKINKADARASQQAVQKAAKDIDAFAKSNEKLARIAGVTAKAIDSQVLPFDKLAKASTRATNATVRNEDKKQKAIGQTNAALQQQGLLSKKNIGELAEFRQAGRLQSFALQNVSMLAPGAAGGAVAQFSGAFNMLDTIPKLDLTLIALKESVVENISAIGARGKGYIGALGAAGIAIGATAFIVKQATKRYEEQKEQIQEMLAAEVELRALQRDGTQEQIQAKIDQKEADRQALIDATDIAAARREAIVSAYAAEQDISVEAARQTLRSVTTGVIGLLGPVLKESIGEFQQLGNTMVENIGKAQALDVELVGLKMTLTETGVVSRSAALQHRDIVTAAAAEDAALQRTLVQASTQSSEATQARIDAIDTERGILLEQINALDVVGADTLALKRSYIELGRESEGLRQLLESEILVRERETAFIKGQEATLERFNESRKAAAEDAKKRVEQLQAINEKIADINEAHTKKLTDIAANLSSALGDADVKKSETLSKTEADARTSRTESREKALDDLEKLEEEHERNIEKIKRRADASIANAIGNRDALALLTAKQARDEQVKSEKESFAESRKAIDDQLRQTNKQIEKRLIEQRRTAEKQYDEMVRKAHEASDKQIKIESEKHNALILAQRLASQKIIQEAQNAALLAAAITKAGADGVLDIHGGFWRSALAQAKAALSALSSTASGTTTGAGKSKITLISGGTTSGIGGKIAGKTVSRTVPAFQFGGTVERTGLAFVHAGERILTRQQQQNGGVNVNIGSIRGSSRKQIKEQVFFELEKALDEAGIGV